MSTIKTALISAWEKNQALANFARALQGLGFKIISSGGTKIFLEGLSNFNVTDVSELTGQKAVLDHRVVTLSPQIHGGLLAEQRHLQELAQLGWPKIDLVAVTFYPLEKKLAESEDPDAINEAVDIGGPAMIRSACKGGRIVVTDEKDFDWVVNGIETNRLSLCDIEWLQAVAAARVLQYQASENLFRVRKLKPIEVPI